MRRLALVLIACPMLALSFGPQVRNMMLEIASRRADVGPTTEGLVMYYAMRNDGTTVFDEEGDNDGTATGADFDAAYGVRGNGVFLDAALNSQILTTYTRPEPKAFTVSYWIRSDFDFEGGSLYYHVFDDDDGTGRVAFRVRFSGLDPPLRLECSPRTDEGVETIQVGLEPTTIFEDWQHIVWTYDETNVRLYINGENLLTEPASLPKVSANAFIIGYTPNPFSTSRRFTGMLDELRVYNRALTAAEITDLYNWDKAGAGH